MPQQPVANVVPVEPDIPLVVVPAIVDVPGQGVAETLGTGTPMGALTPEVPSSVAPSGIVLPLPMVPSPDPAAGVAAVPAAAPVVPEPQVLPVVEPGVAPPPSKVELDPEIPLPEPVIPELDPVIPVLDPTVPVMGVVAPKHDMPPASGLIPPVLSSVAPSGMPTDPEGVLKFIVPSGDVAPMPGMGLTCAKLLAPPRRTMTAAMARIRRIEASLCLRTQAGCAGVIVAVVAGDRSLVERCRSYATLR
jgi:hypothetical protein